MSYQKTVLALTDIDGLLRGKYINQSKLDLALAKDTGFCNVVFGWDMADVPYNNTQKVGWHTGYPDAKFTIDPSSKRNLAWEKDTYFYLGDFSEDENLSSVCPRSLLKTFIQKAQKQGLSFHSGFEYEFYNFQGKDSNISSYQNIDLPQPITDGMFGYSLLRLHQNQDYINAIWENLNKFNVEIEGIHTETGPGVYEACIQFQDVLKASDDAICFKYGVKRTAQQFGYLASFMAKWTENLPGCGGHVHQSITSTQFGEFEFTDKPNQVLAHYLAGQLYWMPKLMLLFAPNINSYKRYVKGSWAATALSWSVDNRTSPLRVIKMANNKARVEHRLAGADANPYLVSLAMIAAGMDGITQKRPLYQPQLQGNAYDKKLPSLPLTFEGAIQNFEQDLPEISSLLGEDFAKHYLSTRKSELKAYQNVVTNWERNRYLETL